MVKRKSMRSIPQSRPLHAVNDEKASMPTHSRRPLPSVARLRRPSSRRVE